MLLMPRMLDEMLDDENARRWTVTVTATVTLAQPPTSDVRPH